MCQDKFISFTRALVIQQRHIRGINRRFFPFFLALRIIILKSRSDITKKPRFIKANIPGLNQSLPCNCFHKVAIISVSKKYGHFTTISLLVSSLLWVYENPTNTTPNPQILQIPLLASLPEMWRFSCCPRRYSIPNKHASSY